MIPEDLRYTAEHEWVAGDGSGPVRVGITHFAQDALGDIVYVQLPEEGTELAAGDSMGEVESTKSVSEIYAPIAGTVVARNDTLGDEPELINAEPYAAGWLVEIAPADPAAVAGLLDAAAYQALTES
ncbi:glycine cleavage system H protein [Actinoplanes ianthinogenes]|uniref:Glycine cleavage system H protein n=2 Tax=Actinoplanes TaxID=1865 RepID=A0A7W7MBY8_9ACTN|nr:MULTISPECIES: glycine cleavage system protein GcvH [Actinoplanes]MBB4744270.1 glycine cleavage system H protein [Actinoplanes octamycinicus]BCJ40147.1 glycine cleavage system H protein [Actinoplanes ianthinogenes]GGR10565.1 glycine cleavage system H protein [Actinoplanes ianthinogenes]GIE56772.1 glycine cleavage system H protein [Actinoplanes octamycinicus]